MSKPAAHRDIHDDPTRAPETQTIDSELVDKRKPEKRDLPFKLGSFNVVRALGRGGMGIVFEATQPHLGDRPVALKLMLQSSSSPARAKRFAFEAMVLARMQHPNIVTLYDAGEIASGNATTRFIAMERIYGRTLIQHADRNRLTLPQRLDLFAQLCDATAAIHSKGVIHRNLSPHNVLVTTLGEQSVVKVIDFGIARLADRRDHLHAPDERAGQLFGSLAYMPPEQAQGLDTIDTRADIYVLGLVLSELLTGRRVIVDRPSSSGKINVKRIVQRVVHEPVPPPSESYEGDEEHVSSAAEARRASARELIKQLRSGLDDIVARCTAKQPSDRYTAAHELARDVRAWQPPKRGLFGT